MTEFVPAVFLPIVLRNSIKYKVLSNHSFTVIEKTFVGAEAAGTSTFLEWENDKFTVVSRICKRYHIPHTTVYQWLNKVKMGSEITGLSGRPTVMDAAAGAEFIATLKARADAKDAVPHMETLQLINKGVSDTLMRKGKRGTAAISSICLNTQKKVFKDYKVVKLKPQIMTDARLKACSCPRISYIWGCVCMAYSAHLHAECKWNADATTIIVSEKGTGSYVCAIKDEDNHAPVASSSIPDNLNLLVKWFGLSNAGGESGPLVLIIAVPSMAEDTFFAAQITCMQSTTTCGEKGWLYISQTRGGCYSMWVHYYLNVTVPMITLSNETHEHKVSSSCQSRTALLIFRFIDNTYIIIMQNIDGSPMRNYYSQDGEAEILIPAMDEEVQAAFEGANTDFIKGPPSATGIHQAWDRSTNFRDTKTGMETVTKNGTDTSNPTLARNIRRAITQLRVEFPVANEAKIIAAIETLCYVQKNGYVTSRKHREGYKV